MEGEIMNFETALKDKLAEVNREIKENIETVKILEAERKVLLDAREMLETLAEHYKFNEKQEKN